MSFVNGSPWPLGNSIVKLPAPSATPWLAVAFVVAVLTAGCGPPFAEERQTAEKHLENQHYAKAVAVLNRVLQQAPDHEDALRMRALANFALGKLDDSLADYEKLRSINDSASAAHNHAVVMQHAWQHQAAIKELKWLVQQDPDNPAYRVDLAKSQAVLMEFDDANAALNHDAVPHDYEYYLLAGTVKSGLGQLAEAEAALTKAIKEKPNSAQAYHQRALVRKAKGDDLLAAEDTTVAEALNMSKAGSLEMRDLVGKFQSEVSKKASGKSNDSE